jgi:hypothetical protein
MLIYTTRLPTSSLARVTTANRVRRNLLRRRFNEIGDTARTFISFSAHFKKDLEMLMFYDSFANIVTGAGDYGKQGSTKPSPQKV